VCRAYQHIYGVSLNYAGNLGWPPSKNHPTKERTDTDREERNTMAHHSYAILLKPNIVKMNLFTLPVFRENGFYCNELQEREISEKEQVCEEDGSVRQ
jgi:hypothetical protein